jgi:hypothetical protein
MVIVNPMESKMNTQNNLLITYGTREFDFSVLPAQSLRAMLSRGLTHFLGSEQASKTSPTSTWRTKFEKDNKRAPTEDEIAAQKTLNVAEAVKAIEAGTIGTARGPKTDPIESGIETMAESEVWNILAGQKLCKGNKKPKDEDVFEFVDGSKSTFGEMVERRVVKHGERLRAAVEKKLELERKAREAALAKASKPIEGGATLSALGLD